MILSPHDGESVRRTSSGEAGRTFTVGVRTTKPKTLFVEVAEPTAIHVRGYVDARDFETVVNVLREGGVGRRRGFAGRFYVGELVDGDRGGYVDWGNDGDHVWIYPNRRGIATDWCHLGRREMTADTEAAWEELDPGDLTPRPVDRS
jgi:hypothetical protein